jgi:hypothetical protein
MLTHLAQWQRFHGPLIALAVTLALALAGRFLRMTLLATAAGGAGVVAGWCAVTGRLWTFSPQPSLDTLTGLAAAALVTGLFFGWLGSDRQTWICTALAALAAGWLLSGAPRHQAALRASWPVGLGVFVAVLVFVRLLAIGTSGPLRLALAGLTLAAALSIAGSPPVWAQLALVPGLAALAMFAFPSPPVLAAVPVAVDIAALGCLAAIDLGRFPRLGFAPVDAAAIAPLLAVWLQPRAAERMGRLGRMAPPAGGVLAGAIAVGLVWLARRAFGR